MNDNPKPGQNAGLIRVETMTAPELRRWLRGLRGQWIVYVEHSPGLAIRTSRSGLVADLRAVGATRPFVLTITYADDPLDHNEIYMWAAGT